MCFFYYYEAGLGSILCILRYVGLVTSVLPAVEKQLDAPAQRQSVVLLWIRSAKEKKKEKKRRISVLHTLKRRPLNLLQVILTVHDSNTTS